LIPALHNSVRISLTTFYTYFHVTDWALIGAGSADFRRFVQDFYHDNASPSGTGQLGSTQASPVFRQDFFEKVWDWARNHEDVRIVYRNEHRDLSLPDFETLESQESDVNGTGITSEGQSTATRHNPRETAQSSICTPVSREDFRESLRKRLLAEGHALDDIVPIQPTEADAPSHVSSPLRQSICESDEHPVAHTDGVQISGLPSNTGSESGDHDVMQETQPVETVRPGSHPVRNQNGPRTIQKTIVRKRPIFDKIDSSTVGPRIYVSQNRTWQAVAGHSIDLTRVPGMQFVLLSIIAAKGADGILQPELTKLSGQDKRSVPGRTDELAQAGYIEKKPVQAGTVRTSLLVHKKFVKEGHFLKGSDNIEDVFRNRTVILTGFVGILYKLFQDEDTDFIPMRDLRKKLVRAETHFVAMRLTFK
jgi:transcription factor C subunit 3